MIQRNPEASVQGTLRFAVNRTLRFRRRREPEGWGPRAAPGLGCQRRQLQIHRLATARNRDDYLSGLKTRFTAANANRARKNPNRIAKPSKPVRTCDTGVRGAALRRDFDGHSRPGGEKRRRPIRTLPLINSRHPSNSSYRRLRMLWIMLVAVGLTALSAPPARHGRRRAGRKHYSERRRASCRYSECSPADHI